MRALTRPQQLANLTVPALWLAVERRPPLQQLLHTLRPFGDKHLRSSAIHQPIARRHRVFQVQRDILLATHRHRDSTLRIGRVRLGQLLLGHHQHRTRFRQPNRRTQPSNPCTDHKKINTFHTSMLLLTKLL